MSKPRPTAMNLQLKRALRNLKRMTPEERAALLVKSGAIPADKAPLVAAYYAAEAAKAKAAG